MEINDNVIPASSSVIANNLFALGHLLDNSDYLNMAQLQLNNIKSAMPSYGSGYSNWAILMLNYIAPFYEVAIVGDQALQKVLDFKQYYAQTPCY